MRTKKQVLAQMEKELAKIPGGWSRGDRVFACKVATLVLERLLNIEEALATNGHAKRKPSKWNVFFAAGMKAGKSPKQIGQEWRARKS